VKYAALLTSAVEDYEKWDAMSPEEVQAARAEEMPKWGALYERHRESGALAGFGAELDTPKKAKTVRVRNGETIVTDGPYAETKELLGGLIQIEADDLDAAIAIAAQIPVAEYGSVELRPIVTP
jgi:hypothetical protein